MRRGSLFLLSRSQPIHLSEPVEDEDYARAHQPEEATLLSVRQNKDLERRFDSAIPSNWNTL
jgi:hypothetical protein